MDVRCPSVDDDDSAQSSRYICVDPARLARLVAATLVDDGGGGAGGGAPTGRRCFVRVDAERFWPTRLGWTRPAPRTVVSAVDDIAKYGVVHEALFPILWQVRVRWCHDSGKVLHSNWLCPSFRSSIRFQNSF